MKRGKGGVMEWQNVKSFVKHSPDILYLLIFGPPIRYRVFQKLLLLAGHTANIQQVNFYAKDNMLCKFSCLIILAGQFTSCEVFVNF